MSYNVTNIILCTILLYMYILSGHYTLFYLVRIIYPYDNITREKHLMVDLKVFFHSRHFSGYIYIYGNDVIKVFQMT